MDINARPELGWTALQYAAHRLDDADCAAFEEQLADDQDAREAVAQAVELSHCVAMLHYREDAVLHGIGGGTDAIGAALTTVAEAPRAELPSRFPWRPAAWISIGVAASLAFVLINFGWRAQNSQETPADMLSMTALSMTWADLHNAPLSPDSPGSVLARDGNRARDGQSGDPIEDVSSGPLVVPDWLMLGLAEDHEPSN